MKYIFKRNVFFFLVIQYSVSIDFNLCVKIIEYSSIDLIIIQRLGLQCISTILNFTYLSIFLFIKDFFTKREAPYTKWEQFVQDKFRKYSLPVFNTHYRDHCPQDQESRSPVQQSSRRPDSRYQSRRLLDNLCRTSHLQGHFAESCVRRPG